MAALIYAEALFLYVKNQKTPFKSRKLQIFSVLLWRPFKEAADNKGLFPHEIRASRTKKQRQIFAAQRKKNEEVIHSNLDPLAPTFRPKAEYANLKTLQEWDGIKILSMNVNSIQSLDKHALLQQGITRINPDIGILSETKFGSDDPDFKVPGY